MYPIWEGSKKLETVHEPKLFAVPSGATADSEAKEKISIMLVFFKVVVSVCAWVPVCSGPQDTGGRASLFLSVLSP